MVQEATIPLSTWLFSTEKAPESHFPSKSTVSIHTPVRGLPLPVGDEAVIAVGGEEGQLGTGRGLHPPDDEPYRRRTGALDLLGLSLSGENRRNWAASPTWRSCPWEVIS